MGWLDRLGNTMYAVGNTAWAAPGFILDLATVGMPWRDDVEHEGVIGAITSDARARFSSAMMPITKEDTFTQPVLQPVTNALYEGYTIGVSRPATYLLRTGQQAAVDVAQGEFSEAFGGLYAAGPGAATRVDDAYAAFRRSREGGASFATAMEEYQKVLYGEGVITTSPGQQAVAPIFSMFRGAKEGASPAEGMRIYEEAVRNPETYANYRGFSFASGLTDAAFAWSLDPAAAAGTGIASARRLAVVRPVTETAVGLQVAAPTLRAPGRKVSIDEYLVGNHWAKFRDELVLPNQGNARKIYLSNQALQRTAAGPAIASVLAEAGDAATVDLIGRVALGDTRAAQALVGQRDDLLAQIRHLDSERDPIMTLAMQPLHDGRRTLQEDPTAWTDTVAEINALEARTTMLERILDTRKGMMSSTPGSLLPGAQNTAGAARYRFLTFDVASHGIYSTPVRVLRSFADRTPPGLVAVHDGTAWTGVDAMLKRVSLDPARHDELVTAVMRAGTSEGALHDAIEAAEHAALEALAVKHGLDNPDAVKAIMAAHGRNRDTVRAQLRDKRAYTAAKDSEGNYVDIVSDADGEVMHIAAPLVTQLVNSFPLMDLDAYERVLRRHGSRLNRLWENSTTQDITSFASGGLDVFSHVWKTSVLMRLGYTPRVLGDDWLRIGMKFGTAARLGDLGQGGANFLRNAKTRIDLTELRISERARLTAVERRLREKAESGPLNPDEQAFLDKLPELRESAATSLREVRKLEQTGKAKIGAVGTMHRGVYVPGAYEGPIGKVMEQVASSNDNWMNWRYAEMDNVRVAREGTGWDRTITPSRNDPDENLRHLDAWEYAINKQLALDPLARRILAGEDPAAAASWLRGEGRSHRARIPIYGSDPEDWAHRVAIIVDTYVPDALREKALAGKITRADLEDVPIEARPAVHGPTVSVNLGSHDFISDYNKFTGWAMKWLNTMPTDKLSRHPTYARIYDNQMRKFVDAHWADGATELSADDWVHFQRMAHHQARDDLKALLYDISARSTAAHAMRYVMPFFGAWQNVLSSYLKLGIEDPSRLRKLQMLWDAPARAGMVVDQYGEPVAAGTPSNDDQMILVQLPDWLTNTIPGMKGRDQWRISRTSANIVTQGHWWNPGAGPLVQIPVNQAVKNRPDVAENLEAILPFGTVKGTLGEELWNFLGPTTAKRLVSQYNAEDDRAYAANMMYIAQLEVWRYQTGQRADRPSWKEIEQRTADFAKIRTAAAFTLPFASQFGSSKAQFYIDQWRKLRDDPTVADPEAEFLLNFGEDAFVFTSAVSKNNAKVPATVNAVKASARYADLIEKFPELGGLIVGQDGAGPFSSAAYNYQIATKIGPGQSTTFRERQSPAESLAANQVDLGWIKYSKLTNGLDAILYSRGLRTYQQSGAEDLAAIKRAATQALVDENPDWAKDFLITDAGALARRIEGMRAISADPRLLSNPIRTDIQVLRKYLAVRDQFLSLLRARKAAGGDATLNAESNQDLARAWEAVQGILVESDTAFAELFHRRLENDQLQDVGGYL